MNPQTLQRYAPTLAKRGEGAPRILLFFFIAAAFSGLIAMVVIIVVLASTSTSKAVLDEQRDVNVYSGSVTRSLATVINLQYSDEESASCLTTNTEIGGYHRPVTLTLRFKTNNVPNRCDMFVNNALILSERRIETDCGLQCPFSDFNRQFSLGELDYRDNHVVRVCCDGICLDNTIERLCPR